MIAAIRLLKLTLVQFSEKEIPILAEEKINERQIKMCFEACKKSFWEALFD